MLVSEAVGKDGLLAAAPSMGKEGLLEMSPSIGKEGLLEAAPSTGKEGLQAVAVSLQTVAVCVILGCWLLGAVRLLCAYLDNPARSAALVVFGAIAASGLLLFPAWRKANELFRRSDSAAIPGKPKEAGKPSLALLIKLIGTTRLFHVTANAGQTLAQVVDYVNTRSKPKGDEDSELFFLNPLDPVLPEVLLDPELMDDKTLEQLGFGEGALWRRRRSPRQATCDVHVTSGKGGGTSS